MYLLACFQLGSVLCFENRAVWILNFFTVRDIKMSAHKHVKYMQNIDSSDSWARPY